MVDFQKNCKMIRGKSHELSGIPIYYYRCPDCRFIFTRAFDQFTKEDFQRTMDQDATRRRKEQKKDDG